MFTHSPPSYSRSRNKFLVFPYTYELDELEHQLNSISHYSSENRFELYDIYRKIINIEKTNSRLPARFFITKGFCLEKMNKHTEAFFFYEETRRKFPGHFQAYAFPAVLHQKRGEYEECKNLLTRCISILCVDEDGMERRKIFSESQRKYLAMANILLAESCAVLGNEVEEKKALDEARDWDRFFFENEKDSFLNETLDIPIRHKNKTIDDEAVTSGSFSDGLSGLLRLGYGIFSRTVTTIRDNYHKAEEFMLKR